MSILNPTLPSCSDLISTNIWPSKNEHIQSWWALNFWIFFQHQRMMWKRGHYLEELLLVFDIKPLVFYTRQFLLVQELILLNWKHCATSPALAICEPYHLIIHPKCSCMAVWNRGREYTHIYISWWSIVFDIKATQSELTWYLGPSRNFSTKDWLMIEIIRHTAPERNLV